jgi:magnesium chelatase family protein
MMDELPEFSRTALEALRQPLEDGDVTLVRAQGSFSMPARFMLVAAMNPCPCGHASDANPERCRCTPGAKEQYRRRISGPILDRFDLHIEAPAVAARTLSGEPEGETSATVRERVERARAIQRERYAGLPFVACNAQLRGALLRMLCAPTDAARAWLSGLIEMRRLSARAHDRILKVARTIADLEGAPTVAEQHINEAAELRCLDRAVESYRPGAVSAVQIARHAALQKSPGTQPGEHPKREKT